MTPAVLSITDIPQSIRPIAHFVKIANDYADRDIAIYYWCLLKAVGDGMKLDSSSQESKKFLYGMMNILEQVKKEHQNNDTVMQELVAQSHIEDQAQRLFQYAEAQDSQGQFNQKMVKAFYTCGYLFDVLELFGTLDENIQSARKYSKWRATYIFGCLKRGEQPVPGNQKQQQDESLNQPSGNSADFAREINDELSAELNALNASINGPAKPTPSTTYSYSQPTNQEYGFGGYGQQQQPYNTGGTSYGQYPVFSQPPPTTTAFSPGPKPGLQQQPFRQEPSPYQPPLANKSPIYPSSGSSSTQSFSSASVSPAKQAPLQPSQQIAPTLKLEDYLEAKKYTKFASSALDYEDPKTAIDYLQKAIAVLQKQPSV